MDVLPVFGSGEVWLDVPDLRLTATSGLVISDDNKLELERMVLTAYSREVVVEWWVCSTCYYSDSLLHLWSLLAEVLWLQVRDSCLIYVMLTVDNSS